MSDYTDTALAVGHPSFIGSSDSLDSANSMDELFNVGFHEAQKQREMTRAERERLVLDCRTVMATKNGLALLFNLIDQTGVFAPSFTGNSATFYLEGRRSVGLYLYQLLMEADPMALQKIIDYRRSLGKSKKAG